MNSVVAAVGGDLKPIKKIKRTKVEMKNASNNKV